MSSIDQHPSSEIDWEALRASIRRRVGYHLQGWKPEELEDVTQDVLLKVLRFLERSGPPARLDGLVTVIARRTAAERIRAHTRRPKSEPVTEASATTMDEAERYELARLEEHVEWKAWQVLEYFRARQAPCLELANARAMGEGLEQFAARTAQSHAALLKRWSRCMQRLRAAIARGEVPWERPEEMRDEAGA